MNNQLQITDNNKAIALIPFNGICETVYNDGITLINYDDITYHKVKRLKHDTVLNKGETVLLIYYEGELFDCFILDDINGYTQSELINYLICIDIDMHFVSGYKLNNIE
jgi:hypothetical protein